MGAVDDLARGAGAVGGAGGAGVALLARDGEALVGDRGVVRGGTVAGAAVNGNAVLSSLLDGLELYGLIADNSS